MSRVMKDSGIPWIGEIPEGWEVRRIKTIFSERTELSENGDETLLSVSEYYGVANRKDKIADGEFVSRAESLVGYKKCYSGDLVSNIMLAWKGSLGVAPINGIVSPAYCVYKPSDTICPRYYHFLFRTSLYTSIFRLYSKGIIDSRLRLYSPYFFAINTFVPPVAEQEAIAEFLDRKCGEVDEMVSLQEQVIEELKAYKQSVITEAVTKGLNPSAPMKPSNIDWIGQIPTHWDVVKLSLMTSKIGSGKTPTGGATIYTESGIMFLRSQNVYNEGLKLDDVAFIPPSIDETMVNTRVKDGDVLLNITGGSIGRCYCINDKNIRANVNQHVCIIRPISEKLYGKYLQYVINSNVIQTQIRLCQTGSNREELNFEQISNFKIPFMSVSTQQEIADYLDRKCADIDALIALKQQKIEELKQYKKSLIYEYVTGKKQVFPS